MKQIYLIFLLGVFFSAANVNAQVTITGSAPNIANGTVYTTLTGAGGAFAAINAIPTWAGYNIVLTITNNTTETGANALNQPATSSWTSLTFKPSAATTRNITGNVGNGLIRFNGADKVTIDGRFAGSGNYLRFLNTNTSNPTFTFLNDATNNIITYCTIESGTSNAQVGAVLFSTSSGSLGNSNNTISYCNIRENTTSTTYPLCLVVSDGSASAQNSANSIDNCNLFNCYQNGNPGVYVYLKTGSTAWAISNNSFYQTATRTTTSDSRLIPIYIDNSAGNGFQITGNYIGGTAPLCGGTAMTLTTSTNNVANEIYGIYINSTGTSTATTIQNNTIKNISLTTRRRNNNPFSTPEFSFGGIYAFDGSYIIDGNTIGSASGNGSIIINNDNDGGRTYPVYFADGMQLVPTGTLSVTNNTVGSINIGGSSINQVVFFRGALLVGTPSSSVTFSGNLFGSNTTANSIQNSGSAGRISPILGLITATTNNSTLNILNNTVRNITNTSNSNNINNYMTGFSLDGTCPLNITGNNIQDLSISSRSTNITPGTNVMSGIIINNTGTGHTLSGNTISGLKSTPGGIYATSIYGVAINAAGATGSITKNKISDFTNTSTDATSRIFGMNNYNSSNFTFSNNFVSITNSTNTNPLDIEGFHEQTASTANYYFNSVYIGGSAASGSRNSYAFNRTATTTVDIKNNIFYNTRTGGTGYHVGIGNTVNSATGWPSTASNYNDLYSSTPGTVGQWLGTAAVNNRTFSAWQSSTSGDANSINVAPAFTSTSDLHLTAGSNYALKAGNYVTGITTDYDGDLRNLGLPAIGADEYHIDSLWSGNVNTMWNVAGNWDNGIMPNSASNVIIPFGVPNMPALDANRTVNDLKFIKTGTPFFVDINGKTFTINGAITGTGTLTGSSTSNLVLNGAAGTVNFTQTSAATRSLSTLNMGDTSSATLGNALDVYDAINFTAGGNLNLNAKNLTLKSNSTNTARISDLTGSTLSGASNVTVERWIPQRGGISLGGRAYRLLAPTVSSSGTIRQNWMENGLITTPGGTSNPVPNYGTHITGPGGNTNGFDRTQTNEASLYLTTNGVTLNYTPIANTSGTLSPYTGYFLFIRGDRSVSTSMYNTNVPPTPVPLPTTSTTLRATGALQMYTKTKTAFTNPISDVAGTMNLVTNPYPSAIDWNLVYAASTNLKDAYTLWDPNIGYRGDWVTVNTSGITAPSSSNANRYIQPGQAFFVETNTSASTDISIQESHKAVGNNNGVFFVDPATLQTFALNMYYYEGTGYRRLADGITTVYDASYSAAIDENDASDINNWDENLAIARNGKRLAIESRPLINGKDTIFIFMNNMKLMNYELEFKAANFNTPGLVANLVDNFTQTKTQLSTTGTTVVPITVSSNPASAASNRFMVVFENTAGPLPIDISSIKAYEKNNGIQVDWMMSTEQDMDKYEVEKSTDGRHFVKTGTVLSKGNSNIQVNYGWFDATPVVGDNFYRIRAIEKAGTYKYSDIVRVNIGKGISTGISMYPNPFEGNGFNLQLNKFAAGTYTLTMYNILGQQVYNTTLTHGGGSATQFISLGKDLAAGTYTVKINGEGTTLTRTITKK